ncbi:MAG: acyl-CoA thioesterase [Paracoccaceae bacterium]
MDQLSADLFEILRLEKLEENLFRGIGSGGETSMRIFGGQVIAQALSAAYRTVPDDRSCHSLHAYFIRPGNPSNPVVYEVDRSRDGGSFTTRRVIAIQNGQQILNLSASFQAHEEGYSHQHEMPDVVPPEILTSRKEDLKLNINEIPEKFHADILRKRPFELREVTPRHPVSPGIENDAHQIWFRVPASNGQDQRTQQILLAYMSDLNLLGSALRPHALTFFQQKTMMASLDHAFWIHGDIDLSDWNLYSLDAPFAGGARGFNRGSVFSKDGRLVASVAQEGLMRPMKPKE